MTYTEALTRLATAPSVPLALHTFLEARAGGPVVVFKGVDIVAYQPDGFIVLNSVAQAKARINSFLPAGIGWKVYVQGRKWWLVGPGKEPVEFVDGMTIKPDGTLGSVKK